MSQVKFNVCHKETNGVLTSCVHKKSLQEIYEQELFDIKLHNNNQKKNM